MLPPEGAPIEATRVCNKSRNLLGHCGECYCNLLHILSHILTLLAVDDMIVISKPILTVAEVVVATLLLPETLSR